MSEKEKSVEDVKKAALDNITGIAKKAAEESVLSIKADVTKSIAEMQEEMKNFSGGAEEFKKSVQEIKAQIKDMKVTKTSEAIKNSDQALKSGITDVLKSNYEAIKNYSGGVLHFTGKAITVDSFDGGLPEGRSVEGVYRNPYSPVFLRNIFPNISAGSGSFPIWKQGAVTGAAAIWQRGTGTGGADVEKPDVTPTWVKETVNLDWIAGVTDVPREILDDVEFMASEIPFALTYGATGVMAAENKMIIDYIEDHAVDFSLPSGADPFANSLETILAAAFGQMGDDYISPTHILINNWDYLRYLAFNKAAASGEYDYPDLGVGLSVINNQLYINNLQALPLPIVPVGTSYVVSAGHSRYVSRSGLQVRVSEDHADNFKKNMVTYRAEVRSGFFTYNDNSLVKVTLPSPSGGEE